MDDLSRRGLLGVFGGGAAWLGSCFVIGPKAQAFFSALSGPRDLRFECAAFREAGRVVMAIEARAGPWPHRSPLGSDFTRALGRFSKTGEKLFSSPARCADDVLRKYGLLEEFSYRSFGVSKSGFGSNRDAHWYAQLDADMERFGVDINPWWREGYPLDLIIDGREVEWRDGRFVPVET